MRINELLKFLIVCLLLFIGNCRSGLCAYQRDTLAFSHSEMLVCNEIDLNGAILILPKNDTLYFSGGGIKNGIVVFNQTKLINPCFKNCRFKGSVDDTFFNIKDFLGVVESQTDCSLVINDIIKLKSSEESINNPKRLYFPKGTYYIDHPIELFAGFESPITLYGDGNMSTICQRTDNEYIIKVFEQNHIKNLRFIYKNKQYIDDTKSIAIACQRSIFSIFENLTICKAHSAFGYIKLSDQISGYNPTGYKDQCYVSDNFKNIRVYESTGYAFDFMKEIPQGDSGSSYDNVYISNSKWLGEKNNTTTKGAIRSDNTMASFTQLNIEGDNYSSTLISLGGYSRISIQTLHIEGLNNIPKIAEASVQSMLSIDLLDLQFCKFPEKKYVMFGINNDAKIDIRGLCIRPDCKFDKKGIYRIRGISGIVNDNTSVNNFIDGLNIFDK